MELIMINFNYKNQWGHPKTNEEIFVENSSYARHNLKKRILRFNLIPFICSECDLSDEWNGKKIVLQLDHINGINNDNRIENLRFLCPNCHSQQDTFAAKNIKNKRL